MTTDKPAISQHVHNWLMDMPSFSNDLPTLSIQSSKQRPLSVSSQDSINLDDLINANFTTDMVDETDLTTLASIDLDDSNEDFWKLDNVYHHIIPTSNKTKKPYAFEHDNSLNTINLSNLSLYDNDYPKRYDRSGSLSSDNSLSTINSHHYPRIQPLPSTSTSSSIYSSKTNISSCLPRSSSNMLKTPSLSKSETTSNLSRTLSKRATHIPAPKGSMGPTPQRTKSTAPVLQKKSSTGSLPRSTGRITSFIPAPPARSTTSLGISSNYASPPRSSTSLGNQSPKMTLRTPSLIRSPTSIKSSPKLSRSFVK